MADIITNTLQIGNDNLILRDADAQEKVTGLKEDLNESVGELKNALIVSNAEGAIASFPDGGDGFPVRSLKVQLEPIQAGSGDPSPDNVRPISGRDSVTVTRTGKNLFDKSTAVAGKWLNIDTGVEESTSNAYVLSDYIPVKAGKTYVTTNSQSSRRWLYDTNKTPLVKIDGTVFTPTQNGFARITIATNSVSLDAIQVELGSVSTDYEPYNGQQVTIQLGQTVYGGTLDVTQGVLTVDRAMVDLGTLTWDKDTSFQSLFYHAVLSNMKIFPNGSVANWLNSNYKIIRGSSISATDKSIAMLNGDRIYVNDSTYTDASDFNSSMSGVQLAYELANPVTVQLSPQQLTTLLGQNNVWSDADSVSVDYVADTKLYIEQLTEPDSDMVADMNITSGKYFMVGNSLYLATTNIANGAAIVVGVNCTRTSLAEALNAIDS